MAKLTFFSVFKSNLKCAFCKVEKCPVRYMPQRKKFQFYGYKLVVTECEKDEKARKDAMWKTKLP